MREDSEGKYKFFMQDPTALAIMGIDPYTPVAATDQVKEELKQRFKISSSYIRTQGNPFKSESDIGKIAVAGSLDKYNSLTGAMKKYTDAQRKAKVDLTDFDKTYVTPQSVLTQDEIDSINKVNPKFFDTFKASVKSLWTQEKSNKQEFQDTQAYSKVYTKDVEVVKKAGMYSIDEMSGWSEMRIYNLASQ